MYAAMQFMRMTRDKRFTIKNRIKDIQTCHFIVDTTSQHHITTSQHHNIIASQHHSNQLFHIL